MTDVETKPGSINATKPPLTFNMQTAKPQVDENKMVSLKAICAELKIEPRLAREKLRLAIAEPKKFPELAKMHKPKSPWEWPNGSLAEKDARAVLNK